MKTTLTYQASYLGVAFSEQRLREVAANLSDELDRHEVACDTLVGTGLSGALVVPFLARKLRRHFAIVRKPNESSHSLHGIEGTLGERWLFVDDQVETGNTRSRVIEAVRVHATSQEFSTEYVGTYTYLYGGGLYRP